jgi:hypothetical protein
MEGIFFIETKKDEFEIGTYSDWVLSKVNDGKPIEDVFDY